jgi:integrase
VHHGNASARPRKGSGFVRSRTPWRPVLHTGAQIGPPGGTVDIAEIVVEVHGQLYTGPPRTRAGRRSVGLPRVVVEELAAHLGPVGPADAYVFTAEKGGVLRTSNFRIKVWLPAVRAAGLAPLRPHDLRHTAVALWIAAGGNPKEVSVRAGLPLATRPRPGFSTEAVQPAARVNVTWVTPPGEEVASTW